MDNVLISVIIPTLNEEKHIAALITSLLREINVEVIVSDGNSQDQTAQICQQYPVIFINAARGRGPQLNAGAEAAQGDILFFLHADSEIEAGLLEHLREAFLEHRKWGCCKVQFSAPGFLYSLVALSSNLRARYLNSCYGDQGIFCSRELFSLVGGYPDIPLFEDIALSRKLRRYERAYVLPAQVKTSNRRFQAQGALKTLLRMQKLKLLYFLGSNPQKLALEYEARGGKAL